MNRFISILFAHILSFIHVVFILTLIGVVVAYHSHKEELIGTLGRWADNEPLVYACVFGIFLFYVLVVGAMTTFVAMNENLEVISKTLKEIKNQQQLNINEKSVEN